MAEKWAQIQGFEGFYEVSNLGNVRSVERVVDRLRFGKIEKIPRKAITVKQRLNYKGYCDVVLQREGTRKTLLVHRLVAMAFCPQNGGDQVNHINSIRHDNKAGNLEWCTGKENVEHAIANDPNKWGRKAICAIKNGRVAFTFESAKEAERNGFNAGNISSALNGRLRTTGGYEWVLRSDLEALGALD